MHKKQDGFSVYEYDTLQEGIKLKIDHVLYVDKSEQNISGYAQMQPNEVAKLRQESADRETRIFKKICASVSEWEEQAAQTQTLDLALEYLRTSVVSHTYTTNGNGMAAMLSKSAIWFIP